MKGGFSPFYRGRGCWEGTPLVERRQEEGGRWKRPAGASAQNPALLLLRHSPQRERECVCVYVCVFVFMIGGDTGGPEHSQPVPNPFRIPMTPV